MLGTLLLLGGSIAFGLLSGEIFFRLFLKTVPPLALSGFSTSAAHVGFLLYGVGLGVVTWLWSLLAIVLAGFFRPPVEVAGGVR
jgi:hypothetical protein